MLLSCNTDEVWQEHDNLLYKEIESGTLIKSDYLYGVIFSHEYEIILDTLRGFKINPLDMVPMEKITAWEPSIASVAKLEQAWISFYSDGESDSLAISGDKIWKSYRNAKDFGGRQYVGFQNSEGDQFIYFLTAHTEVDYYEKWLFQPFPRTGIDPVNYEVIYSVSGDSIHYLNMY